MDRLTVLVVSDYRRPGDDAWRDERAMLHALARQDVAGPFDIVLAESEARAATFPAELLTIAPRTRVVFLPFAGSAELKDGGVRHCAGELVAVMEADSVPAPDWLRLTVELLTRVPECAAISGRTTYGRDSALKRAMGLIDRAFLDTGGVGPTAHVSNNGAVFRRGWLERHPYSRGENPFVSGWLRNDALRAAGAKLWFHPGAVMVHAFGGLRFAREVHRNNGFAATRRLFVERRGLSLSLRGALARARNWLRAAPDYIEWWDWPLVAALGLALVFEEARGMWHGVRGAELPGTSYR